MNYTRIIYFGASNIFSQTQELLQIMLNRKGLSIVKKTNMTYDNSLWNKYFILTLVFTLITHLMNMMLNQTLPLYISQIGGNKSTIGLMTTVFFLAALIFRSISGSIMDILGRKIVLTLGFAFFATFTLFTGFASSIWILLIFRAITGIGFSGLTTVEPTIVVDVIPHNRQAQGISLLYIPIYMAIAIGPPIASSILNAFDFQAVMVVAGTLGLIGLIATTLLDYEKNHRFPMLSELKPKHTRSKTQETKIMHLSFRNLFEKSALKPSLVQFLIGVSISSIYTYMPDYGATLKIGNIGLFFTFFASTMFFSTFFIGDMIVKFGTGRIFLVSSVLMVSSLGLMAVAKSLPELILAAVLFGFGLSSATPVLNVAVIRRCVPERRGAANATLLASTDIGFILGAPLFGFIAEISDYHFIYFFAAGFSILSLLAYYSVMHEAFKSE